MTGRPPRRKRLPITEAIKHEHPDEMAKRIAQQTKQSIDAVWENYTLKEDDLLDGSLKEKEWRIIEADYCEIDEENRQHLAGLLGAYFIGASVERRASPAVQDVKHKLEKIEQAARDLAKACGVPLGKVAERGVSSAAQVAQPFESAASRYASGLLARELDASGASDFRDVAIQLYGATRRASRSFAVGQKSYRQDKTRSCRPNDLDAFGRTVFALAVWVSEHVEDPSASKGLLANDEPSPFVGFVNRLFNVEILKPLRPSYTSSSLVKRISDVIAIWREVEAEKKKVTAPINSK